MHAKMTEHSFLAGETEKKNCKDFTSRRLAGLSTRILSSSHPFLPHPEITEQLLCKIWFCRHSSTPPKTEKKNKRRRKIRSFGMVGKWLKVRNRVSFSLCLQFWCFCLYFGEKAVSVLGGMEMWLEECNQSED